MAQHEDIPADRILDVAAGIADHLVDVQRSVNRQIDVTQADLLLGVQ